MTPEQARDIYYAARAAAMAEQHAAQSTPVQQNEADLQGWVAVVAAVTKEVDTEWTQRLIDAHTG